MSLASTRAPLEAVLAPYLGTYRDISKNPAALVGPAFWLGAAVPNEYRVDTLEAILQYGGFILHPREFEDDGLHGTATYRLTLIQHSEGGTVEEALYKVLKAMPNAVPGPLVNASDLTLESTSILISEEINLP